MRRVKQPIQSFQEFQHLFVLSNHIGIRQLDVEAFPDSDLPQLARLLLLLGSGRPAADTWGKLIAENWPPTPNGQRIVCLELAGAMGVVLPPKEGEHHVNH